MEAFSLSLNNIIIIQFQVFQLVEKDYQTKLDMLFKKHLYDIAISITKAQEEEVDGIPSQGLMEIYKQYAEHHLTKQNYDAAISQV